MEMVGSIRKASQRDSKAEVRKEPVAVLVAALDKIATWFERQAARDEAQAKNTRFGTLSEAYAADAKNYRAMAKHAREAIAQAGAQVMTSSPQSPDETLGGAKITEKLFQDHMRSLHYPERDSSNGLAPGIGIYLPMRRDPRRAVTCADGFTISVQGGWGKYSSPRDDIAGDYAAWECGFPSAEPLTAELKQRAEDPGRWLDTVYGYVPTAVVIAEIEAHGGFAALPSDERTGPREGGGK
jgi:hypothetical protein